DTVGEALYFCIDPTAGAAQWINTGFDTLGFGSAALAHLGTGPDEVPQNSDLGSAAYLNTGTGSGELLTVDDADSRYVSLSATILAGTGITVSGDWVAGWEIEADIGTPEELRAG